MNNQNPASDFSTSNFSGGLYSNPYTLMGNRYEQAPAYTSIYILDQEKMPKAFPMQSWSDQAGRYYLYWLWFNGEVINQSKRGKNGEELFKFPLRINNLRNIVRKHCSVLFGEAPDGPTSLVQTNVRARNTLMGDKPTDEQKQFASLCENIVNEVWNQSNGRALQQEAGELTQFLGGHVFQVAWESWRDDLIPIRIRSWKADFCLPLWTNGDYWDLTEIYVVCRIEGSIAKNQFGIENVGNFVTYVEHWTKTSYSIFIDGKPLTMIVNGENVTFDGIENPFGFVPFVYIPHLREGGFFGSSHIPDLVGLEQEYNAALANLGDAIQNSIERERYMRNTSQVTDKELPGGKHATNLGMQNPAIKDPPDVWTEDPPQLSQGLVDYPDKVYNQIRRSASMPTVAEGEDEGSQRSGVTLDIRFWPATSHAKSERSFWETGLNIIGRYILQMVHIKNVWKDIDKTLKVDKKFLNGITISQDWYPQIPRDRESIVNEAVTRLQVNGLSIEEFIAKMGDIQNIDDEIQKIEEWAKFTASLSASAPPEGSTLPLLESHYARNNAALEK